jgi:hypothetical protein
MFEEESYSYPLIIKHLSQRRSEGSITIADLLGFIAKPSLSFVEEDDKHPMLRMV